MQTELLNNLRDIHLPEEPGWWPLAPGWWILIAVAVIAICLVLFMRYKKSHAARVDNTNAVVHLPITFYQDRFTAIENQHQQDKDDLQLIQATSILLRKFCIERSPDSAQLTGQAWLEHLNHTFNTNDFTVQYNEALTKNNYAPNANIESATFITFIHKCLHAYSEVSNHA